MTKERVEERSQSSPSWREDEFDRLCNVKSKDLEVFFNLKSVIKARALAHARAWFNL
jgi:hypothetical protein